MKSKLIIKEITLRLRKIKKNIIKKTFYLFIKL